MRAVSTLRMVTVGSADSANESTTVLWSGGCKMLFRSCWTAAWPELSSANVALARSSLLASAVVVYSLHGDGGAAGAGKNPVKRPDGS